jgi:hypothetical protein
VDNASGGDARRTIRGDLAYIELTLDEGRYNFRFR